eukprot:346090-Chlamydomonas_euryale.AAC.11
MQHVDNVRRWLLWPPRRRASRRAAPVPLHEPHFSSYTYAGVRQFSRKGSHVSSASEIMRPLAGSPWYGVKSERGSACLRVCVRVCGRAHEVWGGGDLSAPASCTVGVGKGVRCRHQHVAVLSCRAVGRGDAPCDQ